MMDIWEAEPRLSSQEPRPAGRMIGRTQSSGWRYEGETTTRCYVGNALTKRSTCRVHGSAENPLRVTHLHGETIAIS